MAKKEMSVVARKPGKSRRSKLNKYGQRKRGRKN
jgi:hypothetical protein